MNDNEVLHCEHDWGQKVIYIYYYTNDIYYNTIVILIAKEKPVFRVQNNRLILKSIEKLTNKVNKHFCNCVTVLQNR